MTPEHFNKLIDSVFKDCKELLGRKEKEYSEGRDRLDQFKKGAVLVGGKPHQVLSGMMLKHTTSIYDMVKVDNTNNFPITQWNQKIYDHINYLLLLLAIIEEESVEKVPSVGPVQITGPGYGPGDAKPYHYPEFKKKEV